MKSSQENHYLEQAGRHYDNWELEEAVEQYLKVLEINPNSWKAYNGLANTYFDIEYPRTNPNIDKVIETLEKAISINPSDYEAYYNMGFLVYHLHYGKYDKAKEYYELAAEKEPNAYEIYYQLRHISGLQKQFKDAITFYEKCLEINSKCDDVHYNLARRINIRNRQMKQVCSIGKIPMVFLSENNSAEKPLFEL